MPAPLGTAASSRLYQPCSAAPQPSKSPQFSIPLSEIAVQMLPPSVLLQMPWSEKLPTLRSPETYQAYRLSNIFKHLRDLRVKRCFGIRYTLEALSSLAFKARTHDQQEHLEVV